MASSVPNLALPQELVIFSSGPSKYKPHSGASLHIKNIHSANKNKLNKLKTTFHPEPYKKPH